MHFLLWVVVYLSPVLVTCISMFQSKKKSLNNILKPQKHSLSFWLNAVLPPLLWAGVIFLFSSRSSLPSASYSPLDFVFKKMAHIFVFAVLFFLTHRSFALTSPKYSLKKHWFVPVFICFLYALSDELHQHFVPNRYATLRDVGYDMIGVLAMYLKLTKRI